MMTSEQRFQRDPSVVAREIVGEMVLVPIRQHVGELESIYSLNETATLVWNLLDGQRNLTEISHLVAEEYQAPVEEIANDVLELVSQLQAIGAVQQVT